MHSPGDGHSLRWTIWGGSARKGYPFQAGGIEKGCERAGIKRDFHNVSNRRTKRLIHPSILRGFSSENFSKRRTIGI